MRSFTRISLGILAAWLLLVSVPVESAQARRWKGRIIADDAEKQLIHKVEPVLPEAAKSSRIGGKVLLHATVAKSGEIIEVKVLNGHPLLVPAAVEAVRQWKYRPFLRDGVPAEEQIEVEVPINLEIHPEESEPWNEFSHNFSRGFLAYRQGDSLLATQAFKKAIEVGEPFVHRRHIEFSICLTSVAQIYLNERRYKEAEPLLLRALQLRELHQASDEAEVAEVLAQLATLYDRTKRLDQAESAYRRAISIWEARLHDTQLAELIFAYTRSLARASWGLANLTATLRENVDAEASYETAIRAGSRVFGDAEMDNLVDDYAKFLRRADRKNEISAMKSRARKLRDDRTNRLPHR